MKSKFKVISILFSVLFLQPMLSSSSFALAKRKAVMRAFSFITTGDKASQGECDGESKIPRKLKRLKDMSKADSYLGSELIDPEINAKENQELWKHLYKNKASCNAALAKAPSALMDSQKKDKPDLPPEEPPDSPSDEEEQSE